MADTPEGVASLRLEVATLRDELEKLKKRVKELEENSTEALINKVAFGENK